MNVLLRPVKTEKSTKGNNSFVFEVPVTSSKYQIRQAIKENFGSDVVSVRTIRISGKRRKFKKIERWLPDSKKAIVTLKAGQTIPLFETEKKKASKKKVRK